MKAICAALQRPGSGLEVRDRLWLKITIPQGSPQLLTWYSPRCPAFIGSDVVTWLYARVAGFADRREARKYASQMLKVSLGRFLMVSLTSDHRLDLSGTRSASPRSLSSVTTPSETLPPPPCTASPRCSSRRSGGAGVLPRSSSQPPPLTLWALFLPWYQGLEPGPSIQPSSLQLLPTLKVIWSASDLQSLPTGGLGPIYNPAPPPSAYMGFQGARPVNQSPRWAVFERKI